MKVISQQPRIRRGSYRAVYLGGQKNADSYDLRFEITDRIESGKMFPGVRRGETVLWSVPSDQCLLELAAMSGIDPETCREIDDANLVGQHFIIDVETTGIKSFVTGCTRWRDVARMYQKNQP